MGTNARFTRVEGIDRGRIVLYTLSTCMWCKMAKRLLGDMGVGYEYVDMDTLPAGEKDALKRELLKWNPAGSYPTIVINDSECIKGYDESEIREKLT